MPRKKKCDCEFCKLSRLRTEALKSQNLEFVKGVMDKFSLLWLNTDFDKGYCEAILDGSWPSAERILSESLEKAKQLNR